MELSSWLFPPSSSFWITWSMQTESDTKLDGDKGLGTRAGTALTVSTFSVRVQEWESLGMRLI